MAKKVEFAVSYVTRPGGAPPAAGAGAAAIVAQVMVHQMVRADDATRVAHHIELDAQGRERARRPMSGGRTAFLDAAAYGQAEPAAVLASGSIRQWHRVMSAPPP